MTYVYSVESYWDKEKKRPANKQVCLGKLDKETGAFTFSIFFGRRFCFYGQFQLDLCLKP